MVARWFRIAYAENAFRRSLAEQGLDLEALRAPEAVRAVIGFYRAARAQHVRTRSARAAPAERAARAHVSKLSNTIAFHVSAPWICIQRLNIYTKYITYTK